MLTGIRFKAYPTAEQAQTLSQWLGCARVIWNAKHDEDKYLRTFARKYLPIGTFPEINKAYSHFKSEETSWLKQCPSQILRNSATIWHKTYQDFFQKRCGRPQRKKKSHGSYMWLTREVFRIDVVKGHWLLHIGTDRNNIGVLAVKWHKKPKQMPNSIWIKVANGRWSVSFNYADTLDESTLSSQQEHLDWLRQAPREVLEQWVVGVDRGVARPIQTPDRFFTPDNLALLKQARRERHIKRFQRKLARQKQGSNKHRATKLKIANLHGKTKRVREDFLHKASFNLVASSKVIVLEDLKLKQMTRRAKPKLCEKTGRWLRNNATAKSGLNRSLLGVGLYKFEAFLTYKMYRANKPLVKVSAYNTSRECAVCGHTHEANRRSQATFHCQSCGHTDNADRNAACVIKKRAIDMLLDSGSELSGRGVLRPGQSLGQAFNGSKTGVGKPAPARRARSKKTAVTSEVTA